jgi:type I restriction enzyme S subunit
MCAAGDIILNRMRAFQGAIGISAIAGIVSPDYLVLRPEPSIEGRFLHYLFRSRWFVGEMISRLRGIGSTDQGNVRTPRINAEDLGDIRLQVPSCGEQRIIADFLDAETARIDALITKKRRLIELLDEQDTAIIDSELDDLFAQFHAFPFRRAISHIEQGSSPQCDNVPAADDEWGVIKVSSVKAGGFWPQENKRLPDEIEPETRYEIRVGDLLVTRANTPALVGSAAVVTKMRAKLLLCDKIFRINVTKDLDKHFVVYLSRGTRVRGLCAAASHGTSQSMANLKATEIKEWPIPAAPPAAQRESVERISARLRRTASLRSVIDRQLNLLAEHRQALITAAVTGELEIPAGLGG